MVCSRGPALPSAVRAICAEIDAWTEEPHKIRFEEVPQAALPRDSELVNALTHANPWVRKTARAFILTGGEMLYPNATRALR